jgi:heptaprenyl diphosphate synthase
MIETDDEAAPRRSSGDSKSTRRRLLDQLEPDLKRVESLLVESLAAPVPCLDTMLGHLADAGGKRMRPLLVLAAAREITGPQAACDRVLVAAESTELLHLGSLYHDDVMDNAMTRRSVPSVNAVWGNAKAVIGGDILLSRASSTSIRLGPEEARIISDALEDLCIGQVLEMEWVFRADRSERAYFDSISGKTAALMAACCRLGALEAGATEEQIESLTAVGHHLGIAFQIIDDVLDLLAAEHIVKKPVGNDLREGVYTLPVIIGAAADASLRRWLGRPLADDEVVAARTSFSEGTGVAQAVRVAVACVEEARANLADVGPPRDADRAGSVLDVVAGKILEPLVALELLSATGKQTDGVGVTASDLGSDELPQPPGWRAARERRTVRLPTTSGQA